MIVFLLADGFEEGAQGGRVRGRTAKSKEKKICNQLTLKDDPPLHIIFKLVGYLR